MMSEEGGQKLKSHYGE